MWAIFGACMLLAVAFIFGYQTYKYNETIERFSTLSENDITEIWITVENGPAWKIDDREKISQFLRALQSIEKFDWGKSKDSRTRINISVKSLDVFLRTYARSKDPEYLYGYLETDEEYTSINIFGTFRSKAMRAWVDTNVLNR